MTTGIVSVFISYILLISILRPLYLDTFSVIFFFWGGGGYSIYFRWNCYVNEDASSFFLVLDR